MYNNLKLGKAIAIKTKAGVIVQINSINVDTLGISVSSYLRIHHWKVTLNGHQRYLAGSKIAIHLLK